MDRFIFIAYIDTDNKQRSGNSLVLRSAGMAQTVFKHLNVLALVSVQGKVFTVSCYLLKHV